VRRRDADKFLLQILSPGSQVGSSCARDRPSNLSRVRGPHRHTEQNRRAWNEIARVREAAHTRTSTFKPMSFWADGGVDLPEPILQALGDLSGARVLHLQCATGRDSLSVANLGARVTAADISDEAVEIARANAAEAGIDATFVAADVYALPPELGPFDVVFTYGGGLCWLPDIWAWGGIVAKALDVAGRLVMYEEHPLAGCIEIDGDLVRFASDYFSRAEPLSVGPGWAFFDDGGASTQRKVEFQWPLGDVVTSLARAGLRIERLEEFPPPSHARWRWKDQLEAAQRFPGAFLLGARDE
jgi:SAM-dependent methyltransferase